MSTNQRVLPRALASTIAERDLRGVLWRGILVSLLATFATDAHADQPLTISLWPDGLPVVKDTGGQNEETQDSRIGRKVTRVVNPKLTFHSAGSDGGSQACVVILPGGGYNILAYDLEGKEVAEWLNSIGVHAAIVHYRVPRSKTEAKHLPPLRDAQRALRLVRQHASEWSVDPRRVGVLGFSAGGHLAAVASTNDQLRTYPLTDAADKLSCRPDFTVLVYPAYLNGEPKSNSLTLAEEVAVDEKTPPAIMIHAGDDRVSPVNSVAYFMALRKAKVNAELHIYPSGGHGYGLRPSKHAVTNWPTVVERWLRHLDVLPQGN
jgi:acetyl esterase/lipase